MTQIYIDLKSIDITDLKKTINKDSIDVPIYLPFGSITVAEYISACLLTIKCD